MPRDAEHVARRRATWSRARRGGRCTVAACSSTAASPPSGAGPGRTVTTTTDPTTLPPPTDTATHGGTGRRPRPTHLTPSRPPVTTIDWQEFDEGARDGGRSRCRSTTTIPAGRRSSCSSSVASPTTRTNKIGSLLVNPGGPGFGGVEFALGAEAGYGEELLERFDIVGWDPRGTGFSRAGDRLHRRLRRVLRRLPTSRPTTTPNASRSSTSPRSSPTNCERKNAEILEHIGTNNTRPRHGLDPPGARRGPDLLLRLQLRQRARGDVGDAVPRHRACRRPRRRRRTRTPSRIEGSLQQARGLRGHVDARTSPSAAPTPTARSTTAGTPRRRSTS